MNDTFGAPVTVFIGPNVPSKVETVGKAYWLLSDWPASRRGPSHKKALDACKAVIAGSARADVARAAFVAFARDNDILAPEIEGVIAAASTGALQQPAVPSHSSGRAFKPPIPS